MLASRTATMRRQYTVLTALFILLSTLAGSIAPALAAPAASGVVGAPIIQAGHTSAYVTSIQYLLRHRGYYQPVTGTFGSVTTTNVKAFQRTVPMQQNGIGGPVTWSKLIVEIPAGRSNDAVRAAQVQLRRLGYNVAIDGSYGPATQQAIIALKQRARWSNINTTIGPQTWQLLIGSGAGVTTTVATSSAYALPLAKSALPRYRYERPHHDYPAADLPVWTGARVYAMCTGTVSYVGGTCGLGLVITADDGALYRYCHLDSRAVAAGTRIQTGQFVGISGNTGNSTGPHLHIDIRYGGVQRCPQRMLLAVYEGTAVPHPSTLPTSGCTFVQ